MFKVDFLPEGRVVEWRYTDDGRQHRRVDDYTPRFYVGAQQAGDSVAYDDLRQMYAAHPDVVATEVVERRPGFRRDYESVLAVDVARIDAVTGLARQLRNLTAYPVGELTAFNVDFSRQFRYCLERGRDPTPAAPLSTLHLSAPPTALVDETLSELSIDGTEVTGGPDAVVDAVAKAVAQEDPDIVIWSHADLVPLLHETARGVGRDEFSLSRLETGPAYQQLASESTYSSYGEVGHSPARYNIPGRVSIDRSNTFFYEEAGVDGILDLVERSRKPLQELAWASIGNTLTAIQIREAHARDVLTPWHSWRSEQFKSMRTLDAADRGGFIFAPDVGVHEDVHELDFASLYPNIICTRNVSPDVIRCECHADRADVPELGYAICDDRGYLVDVLEPLVDARDDLKAAIDRERGRETPDGDRIQRLEDRSSALKWILVSCFGYQGFSNAKFGRIECHEAINAYARDILLTAKAAFEAGGWRVVHGIVDSIWVTPDPTVADSDRTDLETIAAEVTADVDIRLEYEAEYDWVAFVPKRTAETGALTRYFGAQADGDLTVRGIEARQRSTPPFVEQVQRDCLRVFDETRDVDAVLARLQTACSALSAGSVAPADLQITTRVSKRPDQYHQETHAVAALRRARDHGLTVHPGQDVEYIVVDDDADGRGRVALAHEPVERYDVGYYTDELVRAIESLLLPLGLDRADIRDELRDTESVSLSAYSVS